MLIRSHNQKTALHSFLLAEFLNFRQNLQNWTVPKYRRKRWPPHRFFFLNLYNAPLAKKSRKRQNNYIQENWSVDEELLFCLFPSLRKIYVIVLMSPLLSFRIYISLLKWGAEMFLYKTNSTWLKKNVILTNTYRWVYKKNQNGYFDTFWSRHLLHVDNRTWGSSTSHLYLKFHPG